MKKAIITFIAFLAISTTSFAQWPVEKGDWLFNLGIGLVNNGFGFGAYPVDLSAEKALTNEWTVGGDIGIVSHGYPADFMRIGPYNYTAFNIGVRGAYHLNSLMPKIGFNNNKVDVYVGGTVGFIHGGWSQNYMDYFNRYSNVYNNYYVFYTFTNAPYFGLYLGIKYYPIPKFCAFTELGAAGSSWVRLGVGYRLGQGDEGNHKPEMKNSKKGKSKNH